VVNPAGVRRTLRPGAQVQFDLILLPHGSREIAALLASSIVRAFSGALPPIVPSADFCVAVRMPCGAPPSWFLRAAPGMTSAIG